ncbi:hypothetical protein ACDT12_13560 [Staphylococcus aureus]
MYLLLFYFRTNLPKQVMMFEDFAFPDHLPSFISHVDVLKYLEKYSDEFQLRRYIRVNIHFQFKF